MKEYTFDELVNIIEELRSENGCPWDKEQTHDSLRQCMMEEAAELLAAIRIYNETGNPENMKEELGDILLQVVMHSVIAKEEDLFTIEDVISGISEKMIRRHPHVFGDAKIGTQEQLLQSWEEIKKNEKEGQSWVKSPLREIPPELPSLTRGVKVAKKADKLPQYYDNATGKSRIPDILSISKQLQENASNIVEICENMETENMKEQEKEAVFREMSGLLRAVCQLSYRAGLQPEQILFDDIESFIGKVE